MHIVSTNEQWSANIYESICCSLLVHVYIQVLTKTTSKLVFTTWSTKQIKHEHAKKNISYKKKHVNKLRVLEIVTKPRNYAPKLQNMVVVPPNLLDSDESNMCPSNPCASTIKAPNLSRLVRALTYIKNKRWGFWYPFCNAPILRIRRRYGDVHTRGENTLTRTLSLSTGHNFHIHKSSSIK